MLMVQSGKEFSLTAKIRNDHGRLADPDEQTIILSDPMGEPVIAVKTPERVSKGVFRATFVLPEDAQEGIWQIAWTTTIKGKGATDIVHIQVVHDVVGRQLGAFEIDIPRKLAITFLGGDE